MSKTDSVDTRRVKGLLFDLDNTLYDATLAYAEGLRRLGLSDTHPDYVRARARAKKHAGSASVAKFNRVLYFKSYLELRDEFSPARLISFVNRYERGVLDSIREQERVLRRKRLLTELGRRYRVTIITNEVCRMQTLKLLAIDGANSSRVGLLTSEELGCEKPAPRLFREALARLGGLTPRQTLMVGDDVRADIKPALSLGMQAVLSTEFAAPVKRVPKQAQRVARLSELGEVLLG